MGIPWWWRRPESPAPGEVAGPADHLVDRSKPVQHLAVLAHRKQGCVVLPIERGSRGYIGRIHQHELDNEIELAHRRGGVGRLHDLPFEQEHHVVDELERDLAVHAEHRTVDVDPFTRPQGNLH
jgi:hypothetical protein